MIDTDDERDDEAEEEPECDPTTTYDPSKQFLQMYAMMGKMLGVTDADPSEHAGHGAGN